MDVGRTFFKISLQANAIYRFGTHFNADFFPQKFYKNNNVVVASGMLLRMWCTVSD